jgi:hypothetical protein
MGDSTGLNGCRLFVQGFAKNPLPPLPMLNPTLFGN